MAAACGADEEVAKKVAPAATQAPVAQVATAAPAMAATAAPVVAAAAELTQVTEVPPEVQAVLDELGITLYMPPASPTEPKRGGTITTATPGEPKMWDIHKYQSYRIRLPLSFSHRKLLRYEAGPGSSPASYVPIPELAESWDIEDGGKRFVFKLRKGVKWHEDPPGVDSVPASLAGRDVVASDWTFTFDRVMENEEATHQRSKLTHAVSWSAPDDYTFVVQNKQIVAAFLTYMATTLMEVLPPEMAELCGDFIIPECSSVGNGPWMYNSYTPGVNTSHVRNPDYWETPYPYIDEVVQLFFGDDRSEDAAFRTGKLDIIGIDTCAISGERYSALSTSNPEKVFPSFPDSLNKRGLWMRQDKPPFDDIRVRRAVSLSIDAVGWVQGPLGGYGLPFRGNMAYGTEFYLGDNDYGDASQWLKYDPERAKALLLEAGYGPGDLKVVLESTPGYGERFTAEVEVSAAFLNDIGMDVTMDMREYTEWFSVGQHGEYDNLAYNWSQAGFSPEDWLWMQFHSSQRGTTHFGIVDPEFDALLDLYTQTIDPTRRIELVREAGIHVVDQAINPLGAYWIYFYGQNERIKNYGYNDEFDNGYALSLAFIDEG